MADNVAITAGAGTSIATDDVGTVHFQKIKLDAGGDGATVPVIAGQQTAAASVPVVLASDDNVAGATKVDDAAFTPATTRVVMSGFEYDDTSPDPVDEGDAGAARMSANRNLYVRVRDNAGNERGLNVDASGQIAVTVASGGIASGGVASGAVASGAFASGALASGSVASGAIASGAIAAGAIAAGATSIAENEDVASAAADRGVKVLVVQKATPVNTAGTDGDYEFLQISDGKLWVQNVGFATTINTSVTRPADTTAYAANDCWSNSTSAPTAGGFTFTDAARISGGSGIITDIWISSSADPATLLQGELWIIDQAGTNINDNAAFTMTDANVLNLVAVVPFTMLTTVAGSGTNSYAHIQNLSIGFTCVGTANLRFLVKVKNAYTPISAEVLNFKLKIIQTN